MLNGSQPLFFIVHNIIGRLSQYDTYRYCGSCHYQEIKTPWYWLHRVDMSYVYTETMEAVSNNGRNKRPCANSLSVTHIQYIPGLLVNYGISNTMVLEIP